MLRDTLNNTKTTSAFNYGSRTASANGTNIIDTAGFSSLLFTIDVAGVTTADSSNYFTFTIQAGDASDLSDGATVTAATGLLGSNLVINNTNLANTRGLMGYTGGKRYARLVATATGTTSAAFSANAIQQHATVAPVGDDPLA
jgi:hypothetical protein